MLTLFEIGEFHQILQLYFPFPHTEKYKLQLEVPNSIMHQLCILQTKLWSH